jgi:ABC-type branched-subunit amino acid transport system substrate-binding protein
MLGADSWHNRRILKHAEALDKARFATGFDPEDTRPATAEFVRAYKLRYAETPLTLSAQAYDAAKMLLQILSKGVTGREELKKGLLGVRDYEGASGRITFNGRNDAVRTITVMEISDGEWRKVQ